MTPVRLVRLGIALVVFSALAMAILARASGLKIGVYRRQALESTLPRKSGLLGVLFWVLAAAQALGGYLLLLAVSLGLLG